jgi:hypothetical protein
MALINIVMQRWTNAFNAVYPDVVPTRLCLCSMDGPLKFYLGDADDNSIEVMVDDNVSEHFVDAIFDAVETEYPHLYLTER